MSARRRIVTPHLTRRLAERKLARLCAWQDESVDNTDHAAAVRATLKLRKYGIDAVTDLKVAHERYMAFKWAVVAKS